MRNTTVRSQARSAISANFPRSSAAVAGDFESLARQVKALGYVGYEFDDFLGSPLLGRLSFGNLLAQRIFVQIGERLPLNVRPILGIPRLPSTKANGFFARGYLHAYAATGDRRWLAEATDLLDWLLAHASPRYSGLAWGNAFDFASRGGFFPAGLPTVVWTAHIGKGFQLAHDLTGQERYAAAVVACGDFVLQELEHHEDDDGVCLAYAPGRVNLVHNSNLLGAVTLLRAWSLDGDAEKRELAGRAFAWSLRHLNEDGSWYYGVGRNYRWIDNFHTAYVIDCLREGRQLAGAELVPQQAIAASYDFWTRTFFLDDWTPRYYHDRTYPLDIQCAAQAIATFAASAVDEPEALASAFAVLAWTKRRLQRTDGLFMFRRRRFWANRLVSIHWGQATMLEALGLLLRCCKGQEGGS